MLVWVACFAALGGFLFGFDLGLIGGALLSIREDFGAGDGVAEVIVGAAKLGAVCGTFLGGALMLYYGRRVAIALDSLFFIVGPLLMAAAQGVGALIVGRFIVGVGIGASAVVVPAYLGEVSPAKFRGRVVELYELLLCVGMLAAALADAAFQGLPGDWRWMVGVPTVPAVLMTFALCLLPESPRWLVIHSKLDDALAVIHRMYTDDQLPRGLQNSNADVNQELLELWSSVEKDKAAAEERRRRRAAEEEERRTKVAPLAGQEDRRGSGGVRFKGGWARLPDQHGGPEGEVDVEALAGVEPLLPLRRVSPPQPLPPLPPLLPAGQLQEGAGRVAAGAGPAGQLALASQASGSGGSEGAEGPVGGGASQLERHASTGSLHVRQPSSDEQQQQQQQLGVPLLQGAGHETAPAAAQLLLPEGSLTPQRRQQQQQQQGAASPFSGGAAAVLSRANSRSPGGGGVGSPGSGGVSADEVLPVPPSLRRIRTRSTEFEIAMEDRTPAAAPLPAMIQPPSASNFRSLLGPPAGAAPAPASGAQHGQQRVAAGAQQGGQPEEEEEEGEGERVSYFEYGREGPGDGGRWWWPWGQGGALQARRHSTVPWTAQQAAAGGGAGRRHGFWRTLGDMMLDVYIVARGPEAGAFRMALWLAFFNQAFASTAIINYAPEVLRRAGVSSHRVAALFTSAVGASKMVGVVLSFLLVDSLGRRPLLLYGSLGCAAAMGVLVAADWLSLVPFLVAGMCAFIFAFSISWAGVFWVLLSEIFSMSVKSPAASAATAMLFLTGAVSDLVFLSLHSLLGPFCFLVFAILALAAAAYVARAVPETKLKTLQEIQQLLGEGSAPGMHGSASELPGLLPPGAARSAPAVELPGRNRHRRRSGWMRWR